MDTKPITCPKCGEQIEITQALTHQIEESVLASVKEQHKKELQKTQEQVKAEAELLQKNLEQKLVKRFEEKLSQEVKLAKEEAAEDKAKNKELLDQLTDKTRSLRKLQQEKDEVKLEMEKQLALEEEKIRVDATKKAQDEQHLKILEKDKQLQDAIKANEELRRKLQQGSQQMQGEVLELELEDLLRKEFIHDVVTAVSKGVRGADIIQEIHDRNGQVCGRILWETKNARWTNQWLEKLRDDQRGNKAELAVLVSEDLPEDINIYTYRQNVWITSRKYATCLAAALRYNLIAIHGVKQSAIGRNEKTEYLYSYVMSIEFKHHVEAIVEAFQYMQDQTEKEKRYYSAKWAHDEKYIRRVMDNTYGMYGDLKAIVGGALPQIKGLEGESDEASQQSLIDGIA